MTTRFLFKPLGILLTISTLLVSTLPNAPRATAEVTPLRQTGVLESVQGTHTFAGKSGQVVLITITSDEIDSSLTVLAPSGETLASSDDFGRSLNPIVILTLPTTGAYQLIATSPYGQSGTYRVSVRIATPYDQAYANGLRLASERNYAEAIAAFNEAIRLDPKQPSTYIDLADTIYTEATTLNPDERQRVISNYQRAAELYEQAGNTEMANSLRQQATYYQDSEAPR